MSGTLPDDAERTDAEIAVAWRRAVTETKAVLRQASAAWGRHGCPGSAECCQLAVTKRLPHLWPSEWKVLEATLKQARRLLPPARGDGACPFLDAEGKRCTVYEDRPFGCRTFFCQRMTGPQKVPAERTNALLERLEAVNVAVDERAQPRSIFEWLSAARCREAP